MLSLDSNVSKGISILGVLFFYFGGKSGMIDLLIGLLIFLLGTMVGVFLIVLCFANSNDERDE